MSKQRKSRWSRIDWRINRLFHPRPKAAKNVKKYDSVLDSPFQTRAQRREKTSRRFRQFRGVRVHKDTGEKELMYWEWRPTAQHPGVKKAKTRKRNKQAKASRRANR